MNANHLADIYRSYIRCLNAQDWSQLGHFVGEDVQYNGSDLGLGGYRHMLERDFQQIPDLHFEINLLVTESPFVAAKLDFDCSPAGRFLNLDVDGRRITFAENVFYEFHREKIRKVWSVIDKATVEAQLGPNR